MPGTYRLLQGLPGHPWGCSSHSLQLWRLRAGSQWHPLPLLGPRPSALQQGSPPLAGAHSASPSPRWVTALRGLSLGPWTGTWRSRRAPLVCHCFPPAKINMKGALDQWFQPLIGPLEILVKITHRLSRKWYSHKCVCSQTHSQFFLSDSRASPSEVKRSVDSSEENGKMYEKVLCKL